MTNLFALQKANDKRWKAAKVTRQGFNKVAQKMVANKERYIDITRRCRALSSNMPDEAWLFIAVAHNRESNMDFTTHLGQGDPLNKKTTHVPANRGPFFGQDAFERGAVDALIDCAPYAAIANKDWSISGMLTYLERYNGLGYAARGIPSPYVWAGTNQYVKGKYVRDGVFNSETVDTQLGCAGLILAINKILEPINIVIDFVIPEPTLQPILPEPDRIPVEGVFDAVWLQWSLNQLGAVPQLRVDGIAGGATRLAVKAFQTGHKLKVDGIAGTKETIPAIKADLKRLGKPLFPVTVIK